MPIVITEHIDNRNLCEVIGVFKLSEEKQANAVLKVYKEQFPERRYEMDII